jgi:hypothetical protein
MIHAIVMLRRWTLSAVLGLALVMNICGLPVEGHSHAPGEAATPADDHHDGELVSCDTHISQLPNQPPPLLGPAPSAAVDAIVPVPHACGHVPIEPIFIPYRPPLFLLHASLLI